MSHKLAASSAERGSVKLTGHLGGTANSPTVTNHNQLASGDLHTEYVKADGTRAFSGNQSFGGSKITNLGNGEADTDGATYGQLLALFRNQDYKASVRLATAASLDPYTRSGNVITADANGAIGDIDGVTPAQNDRILLKNGAAGADNGIYTLTTVGDGSNPFVLTRATDADASAEVTAGQLVPVEEGTANGGKVWRLTTANPITLNTTSLSFSELSGAVSFGSISKLSGTSADNGVATSAARSDHNHGVTPNSNGDDWGSGSLRWDVYAREFVAGTVATKTADYTVTTGDFYVPVDASGGAVTITLPAASGNTGRLLSIKALVVSGGNVTIDGNGAETIDGAANLVLDAPMAVVLLVCDGTGWNVAA